MPIISISRGEATEGGYVEFTVTLSEAATDAVNVYFRTLLDNTADEGDLYYGLASNSNQGLLTFAPGETSLTIRIRTNYDTTNEVDEFFGVELYNASANAELAGGQNQLQAFGIISDDDGVGVNLAVAVSDPEIVEGDNGTTYAVFEILLSDPAPSAFSATYTTIDGSAVAGQDYVGRSGTINFAAGQQTATVSVQVNGDTVAEGSEFFSLAVTPPNSPLINARGAVGQAMIQDDDSGAGPVVSISDASNLEGGYLRFTVTLSEAAQDAVTVDFRTVLTGSAENDDLYYGIGYNNYTHGTVTFAPGETSQDIFIRTNYDTTDESDEFLALELFNASENVDLAGGQTTLRATGTILDDDGAGTNTAMNVSNPTLVEGDNGVTYAVFEITLSQPASSAFTATYSTIDGSAVAGEDYVAASGSISFVAGQQVASVAVAVLGDTVGELSEQFSLSVVPPGNAAVNARAAVGEATIQDDDSGAGPVISISDASNLEGGYLQFTVTLSEASQDAVTVDFRTVLTGSAENDDLYYGIGYNNYTYGTVTFAPGETSQDIFIRTNYDTTDEFDEFLALELFNASENVDLAGGQTTLRATGTILDDDGAGTNTAMNVSNPTLVEGDNGVTYAVFEITLSQPASSAFTATYSTIDGSAVAGEDYVAASGSISFVAGQQVASVAVAVLGDTVGELSEQFSLSVVPPGNAAVNARAAVGEATIQDDDSGAGPVISISDASNLEGGYLQFTVTLSEASQDAVTVNYRSLLTGSADDDDFYYGIGYNNYTSGTVTFAPGETSLDIFIRTSYDYTDEVDEFFALELFDPSTNAHLAGGETTLRATGTILDDDGAGANTAMFVGNPVIVEADGDARYAVFEIVLSQPASGGFTATYTTVDGTATAGEDYVASNGSVTFVAGQQVASVIVPLIGDSSVEFSETFSLVVTPPNNPLVNGTDAVGDATIIDNDPNDLPVISISDGAAVEGSDIQFILTLSEPSAQEVSVNITLALTGTAAAEDVYGEGSTYTVTFAPGQTTASFFVDTKYDSTDERDESFFLELSDAVNAQLAGGESTLMGTGFLLDNDGVGLNIGLAGEPTVVNEDGTSSQIVEIPVSLSRPSSGTLTFDVTATNGTATAGSDYQLLDSTITFAPGQTQGSVSIRVIGDNVNEATEAFTLSFAAQAGASFGGTIATTEITIIDSENYNSTATAGSDNMVGSVGADNFNGLAGDDIIHSFGGNDTLTGANGNDQLFGGVGADTLYGSAGADRLYGEEGDDRLYGGTQADYLNGGDGADVIDGGDGYDTLEGWAGNDELFGGTGNDRIYGGSGNDLASGQDGNDIIEGGEGDDRIYGGFGNDQLRGDAGDDYIVGNEGDDLIVGGDGNDELRGYANNDRIFGGTGDDRLTGDAGNDYLVGNEGNDVLEGGAGNDELHGREGADSLFGGDGRDRMLGYEDDDYLEGGNGDDVVAGNDGNDTMFGQLGDDRVYGGLGDDILYGGDGSDYLVGNQDNDTLYGEAGNDNIQGRFGNDTMYGGAGNDYIKGGDGSDVLNGGGDFDSLYGEGGVDTFEFTGNWRFDKVMDWEEGETLDLSSQGLRGAGQSDADAFAKLTIAQDGADTVINITGDSYNSIRLIGINANTIDAADFDFGGASGEPASPAKALVSEVQTPELLLDDGKAPVSEGLMGDSFDFAGLDTGSKSAPAPVMEVQPFNTEDRLTDGLALQLADIGIYFDGDHLAIAQDGPADFNPFEYHPMG